MKIFLLITLLATIFSGVTGKGTFSGEGHDFNSYYSGKNLERIAFPLGGMGAGMVCLDGKTADERLRGVQPEGSIH